MAVREVRGLQVYLDLAVLLNGLVDLCLLMGTNALTGYPGQWRRTLPAAVLGGIYGGACLVPGFGFLGGLIWRAVFLLLIAWTAFGLHPGTVRRTGIFLLLTMALGGAAAGMGKRDFLSVAFSGGILWLLCALSRGGAAGTQTYLPLELRLGDRRLRVLALKDTGNSLRDPVTGEPVLVLSGEAACRLTGLTRRQIASPVETLAEAPLPGLRLIPYRAVGSGGLLLGMKVDCVKAGSRELRSVVAFDPGDLGKETVYQALTGGV